MRNKIVFPKGSLYQTGTRQRHTEILASIPLDLVGILNNESIHYPKLHFSRNNSLRDTLGGKFHLTPSSFEAYEIRADGNWQENIFVAPAFTLEYLRDDLWRLSYAVERETYVWNYHYGLHIPKELMVSYR